MLADIVLADTMSSSETMPAETSMPADAMLAEIVPAQKTMTTMATHVKHSVGLRPWFTLKQALAE